MRIKRVDGLYIGRCAFAERKYFKAAGFKFHPELRKWFTDDDDTAMLMYEHTVGNARKRLDNLQAIKLALVAQSFASDCDEVFPAPEGLAFLPYQNAGIQFALEREDTLLADPPGLGKTIQAIGVSNADELTEKILIIPPASLKVNWYREFRKWDTKGLSVGFAESKKERIPDSKPARYKAVPYWPNTDVVIINYEIVHQYREYIDKITWDLLICDESHRLINAKTRQTISILGGGKGKKHMSPISAQRRLFLTGTPITKSPIDLWTIVKACDPKGLGKSWKGFAERYCDAYEDTFGWNTDGACNLKELQQKLRSAFMVRRRKEDVLKDLPPKFREMVFFPQEGLKKLVKEELAVFEENLAALNALNAGFDVEIDKPLKEKTEEEIMELMGDVIDSGFDESLDDLEDGMKVHFEAMSHVREELALAKLPMVFEHVDSLLASDEKVVLFVVHKSVAAALRKKYPQCAYITGEVPEKKRQGEVDRFQEDPDCNIMIGNIAAAGTGYTMTAARIVVFVEFSWLPGDMLQAEDRVHRIGQLNNVLIQYLVINGTLEAYMMEKMQFRIEVIQETLDMEAPDD